VSQINKFSYDSVTRDKLDPVIDAWTVGLSENRRSSLLEYVELLPARKVYVIKEDNVVKAFFSPSEVPAKDMAKTLRFFISPEIYSPDKGITPEQSQYFALLIVESFYAFLKITHIDLDVATCKIHLNDELLISCFMTIAHMLNEEQGEKESEETYNIKTYGKWIEISKK
jgi:hypothetical protein